jgi:hypothetical protein
MGKRRKKAQSAMEYLMTYGWAILIIAVALVVLLQLGVFNPGAFGPKAQPGSCQVYRPGGPLSVFQIRLTGTCNGALPEYVATFSGSSYVNIGNVKVLNSPPQITLSAWIYLQTLGNSNWYNVASKGIWGNAAYDAIIEQNGANLGFFYGSVGPEPSVSVSSGKWYNLVYVASSTQIAMYVNGVSVYSGAGSTATSTTNNALIGSGDNGNAGVYNFVGSIANVQIYNTSLSASDIQALYQEGIGGAPLVLQNLVGWWPLNGNANDYSSDNLTGTNNGVTFTSSWTSGYTPP